MKYRFHAEALSEFKSAAIYYEKQQLGLGVRFTAAVQSAVGVREREELGRCDQRLRFSNLGNSLGRPAKNCLGAYRKLPEGGIA